MPNVALLSLVMCQLLFLPLLGLEKGGRTGSMEEKGVVGQSVSTLPHLLCHPLPGGGTLVASW